MKVACYIFAANQHGPSKIGIARNPKRRANDIGDIPIRRVVWLPDYRAAYEVEQETMRRLTHLGMHARHEWFTCSVEQAHSTVQAVAREWMRALQCDPQCIVVWRTRSHLTMHM